MKRTLATALLVVTATLGTGFGAGACGGHGSGTTTQSEYGTEGVVRALDLGNRSITIQHDDVPGYMPAMTMPFELTSAAQATGIAVGDRVAFRFRPEAGGRHVVVTIRKMP